LNKVINLKKIGTPEDGYISVFESNKDIPFEIKRVYYTYFVPVNVKRGMHAHKKLQQLLWCPYGKIEVILDDGQKKETFILDSPDKGLLVLKGFWRDMYWRKEGSVLCVAVSDYYSEEDYIRDYDEFLKYAKEGYWEK
jgi:dTDP-4-dehydrorhamnose 3,5-epimerase-like enzyme